MSYLSRIYSAVRQLWGKLRDYLFYLRLSLRGRGHTFDHHFKTNIWEGTESVSGPGSGFDNTSNIRAKIPELIDKLPIKKIVDIPCGDFNWMRHVDLDGITYVGGDIVEEIIETNKKNYAKENISFIHIDVLKDDLPDGDLLICRDLLVHFSKRDIWRFIRKLKDSNITYILTTTFVKTEHNKNILTGMWRPINLQMPPFNFPKSDTVIFENVLCDQQYYGSKSLSLYKVSELPLN